MSIRAFVFLTILFIFQSCKNTDGNSDRKPNIIYILADDLGYGEIGVQGQSIIKTPHIDALASSGMRFSQHYSGSPVCAPSRCVLLTGMHTGHAAIRGNDEWRERGEVWDYYAMLKDPNLEGQRPLADSILTLGEVLQDAGYTTGIFGKWGLGAPNTEGIPNKQGFDAFYGYNCQRQAHSLYPTHLWHNEQRVFLNNDTIPYHTPLDSLADPTDPNNYERFFQADYGPEMIHKQALRFMNTHKEKPFFLYYASPLPHLPIQVPKANIESYFTSINEENPYAGNNGYFPNRHPRAAYAAMISYLDQQVGEIVATLKQLGLYENTIIMFSSDNGPTYTGGVDYEYFNSSAPFANGYGRTKGFVYEGGIRVPFITSWPGQIKAGSTNDHISCFYDIMPTLCDIIGLNVPSNTDGISFRASLFGEAQAAHDYLYWEFPSYKGQQAVRMGDWKGIRKNIFDGNMAIELYDLSTDIKEQHNLAAQHPDIVEQIESIMLNAHVPSANERFKFEALGD